MLSLCIICVVRCDLATAYGQRAVMTSVRTEPTCRQLHIRGTGAEIGCSLLPVNRLIPNGPPYFTNSSPNEARRAAIFVSGRPGAPERMSQFLRRLFTCPVNLVN